MEITLTKKKTYNLEPYGKFVLKSKTRQGHLPNIIPVDELHISHHTTMPMTVEEDKAIVKLMKKHKTDILVDGTGHYPLFYTRISGGLTQVGHNKLTLYREDEGFRYLVTNGHTWGAVMVK